MNWIFLLHTEATFAFACWYSNWRGVWQITQILSPRLRVQGRLGLKGACVFACTSHLLGPHWSRFVDITGGKRKCVVVGPCCVHIPLALLFCSFVFVPIGSKQANLVLPCPFTWLFTCCLLVWLVSVYSTLLYVAVHVLSWQLLHSCCQTPLHKFAPTIFIPICFLDCRHWQTVQSGRADAFVYFSPFGLVVITLDRIISFLWLTSFPRKH